MHDAEYPTHMNDIICYRTFVSNVDALHFESVTAKYGVGLEFGGPPKENICHLRTFERAGEGPAWSVVYLTGNCVGISNVRGEWELFLRDTTDEDAISQGCVPMNIVPQSLRG